MFKKDFDFGLYKLSIIVILISLAILLPLYYAISNSPLDILLNCTFKHIFGIPCPGCGGTRAFICLINGDFLSAIYYHAFVVYFLVLYVIFFVSHTFAAILRKCTNKDYHGMNFRSLYIFVGLFIITIQYLLKLFIPGYIL